MKTYLAGPMSGYPEYNYPLFREVEGYLLMRGYDIVSPVNCVAEGENDWKVCMRACIIAMLRCDRVFLLSGWKKSKGATIEVFIAAALEMDFAEIRESTVNPAFYDVWPIKLNKRDALLHLVEAHLPGWLRGLGVLVS